MTSPDTMALKGHTVTDLDIPETVMRDILDASGMIADPARRARFAAKRAAAWGYLRAVADASHATVHMQTQTEGKR
jgi:hypothetical protein